MTFEEWKKQRDAALADAPISGKEIWGAAVEATKEACAVSAWCSGMDTHNEAKGMPCDAREVGSAAARVIRAL